MGESKADEPFEVRILREQIKMLKGAKARVPEPVVDSEAKDKVTVCGWCHGEHEWNEHCLCPSCKKPCYHNKRECYSCHRYAHKECGSFSISLGFVCCECIS
ncbi:MAG: hypothetical protein Harvfovirus50_4 [Harvfovirus sp.]|uniref:Uncharacterized protein n=1 Tax=Harvfovirus sp. TaxID=2487768 RepID=A0A3G5A5Y9_9VIRU|nr:MAG: hypothetical protein Harvfovirus50_4 [Harvfovirus sp.]